MTVEERRATVMWMAETGLDEVKSELLQNIMANRRQIFNAAAGKILTLVLGTLINDSVLETMNYFRLHGMKTEEL